ncbi:MAG: nitrate reductase subunit beta [Thiomargarita sp.]|nr:nitrate reductase subunit beta [Thiomargarita sp.]
MDVRAQVSMTFHLDKCIGCHTCSVACKNIWTDREGTEYMWWNNVETKPGTGYPTKWEDQEQYKGGWQPKGETIQLRVANKASTFANIFHQPHLPTIDDYYEPWTYKYSDLFDSPEGDDQPTARPVSLITGEHIDINSGPNWDDDLSGSMIYAANDPNFNGLTAGQKEAFFELERMVLYYLPRICNHCLNPACVASCPSGALHKRGEDGIVLLDQEVCRAWRFCISACPYKKSYFNWKTGKSEKCILCFPRLESGQPPACFHSCVGRIRYLGVVLYDADKIEAYASAPESELLERQRDMILDPHDPEVIKAAEESGVHFSMVESAQKSPVYKFVKEWKMALPLHPEFRTLPMLFYIPPLLPVLGYIEKGLYNVDTNDYFTSLDKARVPLKYLANMFTAGNEEQIQGVLEKLLAVRTYRRAEEVGDVEAGKLEEMFKKTGLTAEMCEEIFRLTALPTYEERFVVPPMHREAAAELLAEDAYDFKAEVGIGGFKDRPGRGS